jgi:hypothetical protein
MIETLIADTACNGTQKSFPRRHHLGMIPSNRQSDKLWLGTGADVLKLASLVLVAFGLSISLASADSQSDSPSNSNGPNNSAQTTKNANDPVKQQAQLRGYNDLPQASTTNGTKPIDKPLSAIIGRDVDFSIYPGRAPSKQMKALHVKVQNRSDEPLVFDGDHSLIASNGNQIATCITQMELDSVGRPPTTFTGRLSSDLKASVTAAATVGAVQTAETLKKQYGPITKRYEWDEERRQNEESRFGRRLLYPGDTTDGNIYFKAGTSFSGNTLTMPVKSFYDGSDQASLSKPIPASD